MKYLRKFNTESSVFMTVTPNVVLIEDTKKVSYNVPMPSGVYIQHIDGRLLTKDKWVEAGYSNDEANGIAIVDSVKSFIVAKSGIHSNKTWAYGDAASVAVEGIVTTTVNNTAIKDYSGSENTGLILAAIGNQAAVHAAYSYIFPCGERGYLPALGELVILYKYKDAFNAASSAVGGNSLSSEYWSSTQASASMAWRIKNAPSYSTASKTTSSYVRPFMPLLLE